MRTEGRRTNAKASVRRLSQSQIESELRALESKHGMRSSEFYASYLKGELPDSRDYVRWVGLYKMLESAKQSNLSAS